MPKRTLTLPAGVRRLFRLPRTRERVLREQTDEMRLHIELWVAELRAQGMGEADAQLRAAERFGDTNAYLAYADDRAMRLARLDRLRDWLVEWMQDVRFAARHLRKTPSFS